MACWRTSKCGLSWCCWWWYNSFTHTPLCDTCFSLFKIKMSIWTIWTMELIFQKNCDMWFVFCTDQPRNSLARFFGLMERFKRYLYPDRLHSLRTIDRSLQICVSYFFYAYCIRYIFLIELRSESQAQQLFDSGQTFCRSHIALSTECFRWGQSNNHWKSCQHQSSG